MKEKSILFLFLFLLLNSVLAIDFAMDETFQEGETLFAKVSGNFVEPILREDIAFYRGHVRTSIVYDVAKINEVYYIYGQLAEKTPNNYSIVIENVKYQYINQIIEEDLVKNFTILEGAADFTVTPGFLMTEESFFLTIQNLRDTSIIVSRAFGQVEEEQSFFEALFSQETISENSIELFSGEIRELFFEIMQENDSYFDFVTLSSENTNYEVPLYIFGKDLEPKEKDFEFNPSEFSNITLATGSGTNRILYLKNTGEEKIENITLQVSDALKPYVTIFPNNISELKFNDSEKIILTIRSENISFNYAGQLTAKSNNLYAYASLFLYFVEGFVPTNNETENETDRPITATRKLCAEINGTFCGDEEECSVDIIYSKDGNCCQGICEEVKESSSGKLIGWILIVVIIAFLVWFFLAKYKKA
jgi:hypothetical protein